MLIVTIGRDASGKSSTRAHSEPVLGHALNRRDLDRRLGQRGGPDQENPTECKQTTHGITLGKRWWIWGL